MSDENIEAVRAVVEGFNRRDVRGVSALVTEDVVIVPIRAAVEGDTSYRGPDAVSQWFAAVDDSWAKLEVQIDELRDRGDLVLGLGRIRGQGRGSGVAIDVEAGSVSYFRDGLIEKLQIYTDRAAALAAAELSE